GQMLKASNDAELKRRVSELEYEPRQRQQRDLVADAGDGGSGPHPHERRVPEKRRRAAPPRVAQGRRAGAPNCSSTTGASSGSRAASARSNPKHPASIMAPW